MRVFSVLSFFLIFLASTFSSAEYRAYRLGVKYHPEDKDEEEIQVLSTLDDLQYETYYKITPQQQTRIIHHWMCWGRTDDLKEYCPEPPIPTPKPDQSLNVRMPDQQQIPSPPPSVLK